MTAPHSHAATPTETAEVAHDGPGAVDSRGLPFIDDLAWTPRHALPVPDRDAPNGDAQRRCGWCGASDMVAALRVALFDTTEGGPLARCKNLRECDERYFAREDARRAELAKEAAAAVLEPPPAPEKAPVRPARKTAPRKRPVRPSQARQTLLGQASAKTAEAAPGDAPEGGAA